MTLAEIDTEMATVRAALSAVYYAQSYGQGDRTLNRSRIDELEGRLTRLSRQRGELTALGEGARNPMVLTASWNDQ